MKEGYGLTLILLTWRKWWTPNNASKQQMGFNSAFKGLNSGGLFGVLWLWVKGHSLSKCVTDKIYKVYKW